MPPKRKIPTLQSLAANAYHKAEQEKGRAPAAFNKLYDMEPKKITWPEEGGVKFKFAKNKTEKRRREADEAQVIKKHTKQYAKEVAREKAKKDSIANEAYDRAKAGHAEKKARMV